MVTKKDREKGKSKDKTKRKTRQSVRTRKQIVEEGPEEVPNEIPAPEPTVRSLSASDGSESEELCAEERQPKQPLEMHFNSSQFTNICKIQTKCFVTETVKVIKELKPEVKWFTEHPQFHHFFHMPEEPNLKLMGMWMLLLRTIQIQEPDIAWFGVNGVPIRYSMREHALISGLDCHDYPKKHLKLGSYKFVDSYFSNRGKITIEDVKQKLLGMKPCGDRLKMAVLFFLGRIIRGKPKDSGPLDQFILRIVDRLDVCKTFPWGRLTFEDAIKGIKHMMELLKGEPKPTTGFAGFIIPLEILAFECIPSLTKEFRVPVEDCHKECPRMCKSRFKKTSMKGYPLEDIYAALGNTKVIDSMLLPTVDEELLLTRIIDVEREYDREGSESDTWNYWLNVKGKTIWWKEMYELDIAARKFSKKKNQGTVKEVEASSANADLESTLKDLEKRIVKSMEEGFAGLKAQVETKLESLDMRLGSLESKASEMDLRLGSLESKGEEDMDMNHGQYMDMNHGQYMDFEQEEEEAKKNRDDDEQEEDERKKNSENDEQEEEEDDDEQEFERRRVEARLGADEAWRRILSSESDEGVESEKGSEETTRRLRGRTKAEAARKQIHLVGVRQKLRGRTRPPFVVADVVADVEPDVEEKEEKEEKEAEQGEKSIVEEEKKDEESDQKSDENPMEEEKKDEEVVEEAEKVEESDDNPMEEEKKDEEVVEEVVEEAEKAEKEEVLEVEKITEEEGEKYTEEEKQSWYMVVYKGSEELVEEAENPTPVIHSKPKARPKVMAVKYGIPRSETLAKMRAKAMAKKKKAETDGAPKKRGRPRKAETDGAPKKRGRPTKESATLVACTPREKKKSQWLQSPFTGGKTEDFEGPSKKPKTKA